MSPLRRPSARPNVVVDERARTVGVAATAADPPSDQPGITDGSFAAPGMIGEIYMFTNSGSFGTASHQQTFSLALPAGDWQAWAFLQATPAGGQLLQGLEFWSANVTGMNVPMYGSMGPQAPAGGTLTLVGSSAAITIGSTTTIPFTINTNADAAGPSGTFYFNFQARRMR